MTRNPYEPPARETSTRGPRPDWTGTLLLVLAPLVLLLGLSQSGIWADWLEDVSMLARDQPALALAYQRLAWLGAASSLLHVLLGLALIPLGIGARRRRRWGWWGLFVAGSVAVPGCLVVGALLLLHEARRGEVLYLCLPALLVGLGLLAGGRRGLRLPAEPRG